MQRCCLGELLWRRFWPFSMSVPLFFKVTYNAEGGELGDLQLLQQVFLGVVRIHVRPPKMEAALSCSMRRSRGRIVHTGTHTAKARVSLFQHPQTQSILKRANRRYTLYACHY